MNKFLDWTDELSVKNEIIDGQHKNLLDILNDLYEINQQEEYDKLGRIFEEALNYTNYHFDQEEEILKKKNMEEYLNQKAEHLKIREELNFYKTAISPENLKEISAELLLFMQRWLFNHIKVEDKKSFSNLSDK
jgi:hemerythrin